MPPFHDWFQVCSKLRGKVLDAFLGVPDCSQACQAPKELEFDFVEGAPMVGLLFSRRKRSHIRWVNFNEDTLRYFEFWISDGFLLRACSGLQS